MLKQRVITAIILLVVLLGTLLAPGPWPLILFLITTAGCAVWEWLRLTWPSQNTVYPVVVALVMAAVMIVLSVQWLSVTPASWSLEVQRELNAGLLPIVALLWVFGASLLVYRGQVAVRSGGPVLSAFGVVAVLAVWLALVQLFLTHGGWFLVSLLALIWFADIAAYFTGKAFGRHKLAPKISPGKTWEGAVGGVAAATIWVFVSQYWEGSFGAVLATRWSTAAMLVIAVLLAALSIMGDLFESLLKRRAGVKDSSQLLPGHGGVYDRIDALLPVAPIALLLTQGG